MTTASETRNGGRGPGRWPTARLCPAGGCRAKIRRDRLMCAGHWRMVPYRLRALVWSTWRSGAGAGSPEHADACRGAIAAVDELTGVAR